MTDLTISVRGSHSVRVPPERANVDVSVSADGPAPGPVVTMVATVLSEVASSLESRHDPQRGPVTRYSVEQVRKGAHRPYSQDGRQLPLVHTAAASARATFSDFGDLATWVEKVANIEGVGVNHIEWTLTDVTRQSVEREIRQEAVRDAMRRAQDYADALEAGTVVVAAISDTGLSGPGQPKILMARAMADTGGGSADIVLRPEDVEIEAQVEATFVVPRTR